MTILNVKVGKPSTEAYIGITFTRENEYSPLTIGQIKGAGVFGKTPLVPGLVVHKLNEKDARKMSPSEAFNALCRPDGNEISIAAEGFFTRVSKIRKNEDLGMECLPSSSKGVVISNIKEGSKLANTDLKRGLVLLSINGKDPSSPAKTMKILKNALGMVKIIAIQMEDLSQTCDDESVDSTLMNLDAVVEPVEKEHVYSLAKIGRLRVKHHGQFIQPATTHEQEIMTSSLKQKQAEEPKRPIAESIPSPQRTMTIPKHLMETDDQHSPFPIVEHLGDESMEVELESYEQVRAVRKKRVHIKKWLRKRVLIVSIGIMKRLKNIKNLRADSALAKKLPDIESEEKSSSATPLVMINTAQRKKVDVEREISSLENPVAGKSEVVHAKACEAVGNGFHYFERDESLREPKMVQSRPPARVTFTGLDVNYSGEMALLVRSKEENDASIVSSVVDRIPAADTDIGDAERERENWFMQALIPVCDPVFDIGTKEHLDLQECNTFDSDIESSKLINSFGTAEDLNLDTDAGHVWSGYGTSNIATHKEIEVLEFTESNIGKKDGSATNDDVDLDQENRVWCSRYRASDKADEIKSEKKFITRLEEDFAHESSNAMNSYILSDTSIDDGHAAIWCARFGGTTNKKPTDHGPEMEAPDLHTATNKELPLSIDLANPSKSEEDLFDGLMDESDDEDDKESILSESMYDTEDSSNRPLYLLNEDSWSISTSSASQLSSRASKSESMHDTEDSSNQPLHLLNDDNSSISTSGASQLSSRENSTLDYQELTPKVEKIPTNHFNIYLKKFDGM